MEETDSNPFKYPTINFLERQIRLLHIQPGASHDMISCTLETVSLEDNPQYEALSYEWGKPDTNSREIKIDQRIIIVRDNLYWALCYLRRKNDLRTFWIDALCINQVDISERSHQVAQMGDIYHQAARVVAWIGKPDRPSSESDPDKIAVAAEFLYQMSENSIAKFVPSTRLDRYYHKYPDHYTKWKALESLCSRGYWSRLWIVQELVLASDLLVQHGCSTVLWQTFDRVLEEIRTHNKPAYDTSMGSIRESIPYKIAGRRRQRLESLTTDELDQNSTLVELLTQFSFLSCHDIRDRVFGLRSLAPVCCKQAVPADYSMGVVSVCVKLLWHHLNEHRSDRPYSTWSITESVLRALTLRVFGMDLKSRINDEFRCREFERSQMNVPMEMISCGEIVCLKYITKSLISEARRDVRNFNSGLSMSDVSEADLLLSLDKVQSFTTEYNGLCYLNLDSDHVCNEPVRRWPGDFKSTRTPPAFLTRFCVQTITGEVPQHINSTKITHENSQPQRPLGNRAKAESGPCGTFFTDTSIEEGFWKYISYQSTHKLRPRPPQTPEQHAKSLDRLLTWEKLGLVIFLTSNGMVGTATRNVNLGDRVHKINFDGRKLAILSADSGFTQVSGKGLVIGTDSLEKLEKGSRRTVNVDMATLLFLCGYF
jgi:hypothetical protein